MLVLQGIINLVSAAVSPADYTSYSDASSFSFSYSMTGAGSIIVSIIGWVVSLIVGAARAVRVLRRDAGHRQRAAGFGRILLQATQHRQRHHRGLDRRHRHHDRLLPVHRPRANRDHHVDVHRRCFDRPQPVTGRRGQDELRDQQGQLRQRLPRVARLVATFVVGALLCGVGLIVAAPVATLFLVYAYRMLSGGQVAELNPQPLPPGPQPQMGPPPPAVLTTFIGRR